MNAAWHKANAALPAAQQEQMAPLPATPYTTTLKLGDRVVVTASMYSHGGDGDPQLAPGKRGVITQVCNPGRMYGVTMDEGSTERDRASWDGMGWAFAHDELALVDEVQA